MHAQVTRPFSTKRQRDEVLHFLQQKHIVMQDTLVSLLTLRNWLLQDAEQPHSTLQQPPPVHRHILSERPDTQQPAQRPQQQRPQDQVGASHQHEQHALASVSHSSVKQQPACITDCAEAPPTAAVGRADAMRGGAAPSAAAVAAAAAAADLEAWVQGRHDRQGSGNSSNRVQLQAAPQQRAHAAKAKRAEAAGGVQAPASKRRRKPR